MSAERRKNQAGLFGLGAFLTAPVVVLLLVLFGGMSGGSFLAAGFAELPDSGMPVPVYYQNDYADVGLGSSNLAKSGCGFCSCAMAVSYLTGKAVSPCEIAAWGQDYYLPGQGMSWALPNACAVRYGLGTVTMTKDTTAVKNALKSGAPVLCSQSPGLFTRGGHIIVLRGISADGKVWVNDPNRHNAIEKGYQNRSFSLQTEVDSTAKVYWIFER